MNHPSNLTHKPHASRHRLFRVRLKLDIMRDLALAREPLDLLLAIRLPLRDVVCLAHLQRPACVDERLYCVIVACGDDELLVDLGRTRLDGCDESRADPNSRGAVTSDQRRPASIWIISEIDGGAKRTRVQQLGRDRLQYRPQLRP